MLRLIYLAVFIVNCMFIVTSSVLANEYLLPREQYGSVNLTLHQSLISRKESNVSGNGNYEPLSLSPPQDSLRRLSRPIGRLDILYAKGTSTCTATVVSNQYVLTNYHCINASKKFGAVEKLSILMGYYSQLDPDSSERFEVSTIAAASDQGLDFALLRVNGNPANKWGSIRILNRDPYPGESLMLIHHPLGLPLHVTRGRCRAAQPKPISGSDIFHTCDTEAGSSGSPILTIDGTSMVGIHFSGVFGGEAYNRGKRLTEISNKYEIVQQLADSYSSSFPPPINLPPPIENPPTHKLVTISVSAEHDNATVFLKSSFRSLDAMNTAGCDSIKATARHKADQACSEKNAIVRDIEFQKCAYTGNSVRRYSVTASVTCDGPG